MYDKTHYLGRKSKIGGTSIFAPSKKWLGGSKKISPDFMSYLGPKKPKETQKSKLTLRLNRVTQHTTLYLPVKIRRLIKHHLQTFPPQE